MDLNFTSLEKKAIAKVLIDIAIADNKADSYESAYFVQIQEVLNISVAEIEETEYMSVAGCLKIIKNFTPDKKAAMVFMMREMIKVDGDISDEEFSIFQTVCEFAEIGPDVE
ncbi:MAG: TerB family tellurite resistance protein [Bacteroidales bacterium]|jgi:uncharacterized tellurite resistance protein B-like protein|nr:TerB family tellurite resistance protein [Bacteroidales bacterium]